MPELLEFEEPIGVLQKEIEALSMLPTTPAREADIERLQQRIESIRGELYRTLTPWQRVLVAQAPRAPERPRVRGHALHGFHGDPWRSPLRR